jgi:hypothetical protein
MSGHQVRVRHPRAGIWSKNGVPVETVRPMLLWLRDRHGSIRLVAELLSMPYATVRGYVYNRKRKRVPPRAARRIADLVLAHRRRGSALDTWEEAPGVRPRISMRLTTTRRSSSATRDRRVGREGGSTSRAG